MKTCRTCGLARPADEFYRDTRMRDSLSSECKPCKRVRSLNRWNSSDRQPSVRDPEARRASRRSWNLKQYGITPQEYDAMYASQGGLCAICSTPQDVLSVDHCHSTMKVRGLLCQPCNFGLGQFKDDETSLERALAYLREHRNNT